MKMRYFVAGLVLLSLGFASAAAQGGQVQGRVLDAQGAPVAGAKVSVTGGENSRREATTGEDGSYTIEGLDAGYYQVAVTAASGGASLRQEVSVAQGAASVRADFQFPQAAARQAPIAEEENPNIFVYLIDTNSLRHRLQIVRGPDPQFIPEFSAEQNYYGSQYGAPLLQFEVIRPRSLVSVWRGSVSALHQNSALNARNFFNVGPLLPSRSTSYGLSAGGPLFSPAVSALFQFGQSFTSGSVNGNVQAPLANERVPAASDPRVNAILSNLLNAYPAELPNLPGVSLRQLNSNASRSIDTSDGLARLDWKASADSTLSFRYSIDDYSEDPFQIVAGKNPQTDLRNQGAHLGLTQALSPQTIGRFGFHFDRSKALLLPSSRFSELLEPLGITPVPDIDISGEIDGVGPGQQFPRRRIQNRFQYYADLGQTSGRHTWKAGWSTARVQLNDLQSDNSRGTLRFARDFGRSAVDNFLLGRPSTFAITLGNLYRGFRNWEHFLFFEDQFRVSPTFSLSLGVRYELMTAPVEVDNLTDVGFPTDKNNFAPRFGFAWNPRGGRTSVRGSYGMSYGTIFPVTYQTTRFNPPQIQVLRVDTPDFLNPLAGLPQQPGEGGRSERFLLSPDLVMPYTHQYNLSIERTLPWASTVRIAYLGSRSFHIPGQTITNRAQPVPGIPTTTGTINQRRPDPRFLAVKTVESNAIAYFDALQLRFEKRTSHGLAFRSSYTFSKSIDTGADFTNTAIDVQAERGSASSEFGSRFDDLKGWSLFDTPHAFSLSYSYELPFASQANGWKSALLAGWQLSGTTIFQSGTPFHAHTGSDGPGFGNVDGDTVDRPNLLDPSILGKSIDDPDTSTVVFNPSFFDTNIPPGGRGNIGFNVFRKDGTNNWNFAIGKRFPLPGSRERSAQFRVQFINLMNHAQFIKPGIALSNPTFGKITNTVNKGRQVQFSLRLNF